MNQVSLALPRPGPVTKALIALLLLGGVLGGVMFHWIDGGERILEKLMVEPSTFLFRPWSLWTATFVPNPEGGVGFVFSALFAYFLATDLESRWGAARFVRFLLIASAASFGLSLLVNLAVPGGVEAAPAEGSLVAYRFASAGARGLRYLHPTHMYGSSALLAAISAAWARENGASQIRMFLFLPISGRTFLWVTLGFCAIGLIYPNAVPEGPISPFGGFFAGALLAGSPSPIRALYLRAKLALLRRGGQTVRVDLEGPPRVKKPRTGPPLRVVVGGQADDLTKRTPPKDKRFLN